LNVTADYRLGEGEGPMVGGAHPLSNFGINLVANIGSGMPYTKLDDEQVFRVVESFTDDVEGGINEARLPWTGVLDLRVDRRFTLGGSSNLTAFLWVQNLLDSDGVLGVYRVSGEPDTDLFINSDEGIQRAEAFAGGLNDPRAADIFRYHYSQYVDAPNALGGNHYTGGPRYVLPRRVRLGIRLNF
jgi:hypothetical protein